MKDFPTFLAIRPPNALAHCPSYLPDGKLLIWKMTKVCDTVSSGPCINSKRVILISEQKNIVNVFDFKTPTESVLTGEEMAERTAAAQIRAKRHSFGTIRQPKNVTESLGLVREK